MTQPPKEEQERRLVERLAASWDPGPLAPGARVAFNQALAARLHRRRRARRWAPALALAGAAAALAAAWLIWSSAPSFETPAGAQTARAGAYADWEYEVLYPTELDGAQTLDDSALLPDEYLALAGLLDAS
jgi:ferric-dicitrate binding protein FerR (iron transport regulator)